MNKSPAFQFYPADFLSDRNVIVMTAEEVGAYILLISSCWVEGFLLNDIEELAALAKIPVERFETMWQKRLQRCFNLVEANNTLVHPRLQEERQKQESWKEKSAKGGKNSAHKRKQTKEISEQQGGSNLVTTKEQPKVNTSSSSSNSANALYASAGDGLVNGATAHAIQEYQEPIRAVYGTNQLNNLHRWEIAFARAAAENIQPNELANSLRELLAQNRKFPVTPENAVDRVIEHRAKKKLTPAKIPVVGTDYEAMHRAEIVAKVQNRPYETVLQEIIAAR